ncbi:MAG: hypothetical protein DBY30_07790 [Verrucomicrobia bacterium]|nr:MAG: hypothetical protein DBY30_07790 [Verrucomicrobiota bacterium]
MAASIICVSRARPGRINGRKRLRAAIPAGLQRGFFQRDSPHCGRVFALALQGDMRAFPWTLRRKRVSLPLQSGAAANSNFLRAAKPGVI